MKKLFFIVFFFFSFFSAFAQQQNCPQIVFSYDASGNRVQRKLIITDCNAHKTVIESTNAAVSTMQVNVYPNPAKDKINIELGKDDAASEISVLLYDMSGKEIYSAVTYSLQIQVDVAGISSGTYLLKILRGKNFKTYNVIKN